LLGPAHYRLDRALVLVFEENSQDGPSGSFAPSTEKRDLRRRVSTDGLFQNDGGCRGVGANEPERAEVSLQSE
jgi:hypothetical protein